MRLKPLALGLASSALLTSVARADFTITRTSVFNLDVLVPDTQQYVDVQNINLGGATVLDVNVGLVLTPTSEGAFLGDYYAGLGHDTGYAVLLNRAGSTAEDSFGNNANGLSVTFDDSASTDVHLAPNSTSESPPALTGTWKPDAREADPAVVTDATPRTAFLSSFNNTPTDGEWRLLVADDSTGASARLTSWSLSITFAPTGGVLPALGATDTLTVTTGTLDLSTPQTIDAQIVNQGLIIGPSGSNQTLTFTGAVTGGGDFQGNIELLGSYSPGNSPEAVNFYGNTLFGPEHELTMEIGGPSEGTEYDTIAVNGFLGLGGTLNIVFINGFIPLTTDFFQLFTATSFGGNFAQVNLPTGYAAVGGIRFGSGFTLCAIPEPCAVAACAALAVLGFAATRRHRGR